MLTHFQVLGFIPAAMHSQKQKMMTRDETILHFSADTIVDTDS